MNLASYLASISLPLSKQVMVFVELSLPSPSWSECAHYSFLLPSSICSSKSIFILLHSDLVMGVHWWD